MRAGIGVLTALALAGCAGVAELDGGRATGPDPVGFPECQAESYDFAGEGTFRALGLEAAVPVPPPDPERRAMIWVTHDLLPYDSGPPGGPVEMTRMMCFEFPDGSGGSEWPVDAAWQPPGAAASEGQGPAVPQLILVAFAVLLVTVASVVAFRTRR